MSDNNAGAAAMNDLVKRVFDQLDEPDYERARWSHGAPPFHYWSRESITAALEVVEFGDVLSAAAPDLLAAAKAALVQAQGCFFNHYPGDDPAEAAEPEHIAMLRAAITKAEGHVTGHNARRIGPCPNCGWTLKGCSPGACVHETKAAHEPGKPAQKVTSGAPRGEANPSSSPIPESTGELVEALEAARNLLERGEDGNAADFVTLGQMKKIARALLSRHRKG